MLEEVLLEADDKMDKAIKVVEHELNSLRTGRASVHLLDGIKVQAYGTETPLNQLSNINTPDGSTIAIQPWDVGTLGAVEKAILSANLGLTPSNDGKIIRLNIPPLTEQTRKEIVKRAHSIAEEGRVAVRNIRRHSNDEIKKAEKKHEVPEDEGKRLHDQVQKETDEHVKKIDQFLVDKEKEIMSI